MYKNTVAQKDFYDPAGYFARAKIHLVSKRYKEAIDDFDQVLRLSVSSYYSQSYFERGCAYKALKNYDAAIADFNAAIREKIRSFPPGDFPEAHFELGRVKNLLGDPTVALMHFDRAIILNPSYAEAYVERSKTHREMGNPLFADKDFKRAVSYDPSYSQAETASSSAASAPQNISMTVNSVQATIDSHPSISTAGSLEAQLKQYAQIIKEKSESYVSEKMAESAMTQKLMQQDMLVRSKPLEYERIKIQMAVLTLNHQQQGYANSDIAQQLSALKEKQQLLLTDYWKTQEIQQQQDIIAAEPGLRMCYLRLQMKLNEFFVGAQSVASDQLTRAGTTAETVMSGISVLGSLIKLPGVGTVISAASKAVEVYQDKKIGHQAHHISELAVGLARMEVNNEALARKVVLHYKKGLLLLTPKSAGNLGEWASKPVIGYLYQLGIESPLEGSDLVNQMFHAIKRVEPPPLKSTTKFMKKIQQFCDLLGEDANIELKSGGQCSIKTFLSRGIPNAGRIISSFEVETSFEDGGSTLMAAARYETRLLQGQLQKMPSTSNFLT